jgi:hypothetical protein
MNSEMKDSRFFYLLLLLLLIMEVCSTGIIKRTTAIPSRELVLSQQVNEDKCVFLVVISHKRTGSTVLYNTLMGLFADAPEGLVGSNTYDGLQCHARPQNITVVHHVVPVQFRPKGPRVAIAKSHVINCDHWRHRIQNTPSRTLLLVASSRGNLTVPCANVSVPFDELEHKPGNERSVARSVRDLIAPALPPAFRHAANLSSAAARLEAMNGAIHQMKEKSWGQIHSKYQVHGGHRKAWGGMAA